MQEAGLSSVTQRCLSPIVFEESSWQYKDMSWLYHRNEHVFIDYQLIHIAVHHQLTNHNIDWDSAQCLTYSKNYFQQLTLESWYTNLEQTPLN